MPSTDPEASQYINASATLASVNSDITPIGLLLQGATALVLLFVPYCFGECTENSMEKLLKEINDEHALYVTSEIRVVAVTSELPCVNMQWAADIGLSVEVYSDAALNVSNTLVGSFDLSLFMLEKRNVHMGSIFVPMPAVVIVDGDTGRVVAKYVMASPDSVHITSANIIQLVDEQQK